MLTRTTRTACRRLNQKYIFTLSLHLILFARDTFLTICLFDCFQAYPELQGCQSMYMLPLMTVAMEYLSGRPCPHGTLPGLIPPTAVSSLLFVPCFVHSSSDDFYFFVGVYYSQRLWHEVAMEREYHAFREEIEQPVMPCSAVSQFSHKLNRKTD